jgi:integral membrane protein
MDPAFKRYRWMSFITGTTLLSLFATLLLKSVDVSLWKHIHALVVVDGVGHGVVLYPMYMITCFQLVLKFRLNVALLALMFFAGFVPGLAFYLEYRMRRKLYPNSVAG